MSGLKTACDIGDIHTSPLYVIYSWPSSQAFGIFKWFHENLFNNKISWKSCQDFFTSADNKIRICKKIMNCNVGFSVKKNNTQNILTIITM